MKRIVIAAATVVLCGAAAPAGKAFNTELFGIGLGSCASWLVNTRTEAEGSAWILGYWSGLNVNSGISHMVGQHTDGPAIIGETRLICEREPSTQVVDAVNRVYFRFQQEDK